MSMPLTNLTMSCQRLLTIAITFSFALLRLPLSSLGHNTADGGKYAPTKGRFGPLQADFSRKKRSFSTNPMRFCCERVMTARLFGPCAMRKKRSSAGYLRTDPQRI